MIGVVVAATGAAVVAGATGEPVPLQMPMLAVIDRDKYHTSIPLPDGGFFMPRLLLSLATILVAISAVIAQDASGPVKDKNLEAVLRSILREPKADLKDDLLAKVYILEAPGKSIKDLSGLEKCKNLQLIRLDKNQIVNLTPLKELVNVQSLDLNDNQIESVEPLAGLTRLAYLQLGNNKIASVEPLKGLVNLNTLSVAGNQISDLKPLEPLVKLWTLDASRNKIKDLTPVSKLTRLSTLGLSSNVIGDVGPLGSLTDLSLLMIDKNQIKDLSPLLKAAEVDAKGAKRFAPYLRLYVADNPIENRGQLDALKSVGVRVTEK